MRAIELLTASLAVVAALVLPGATCVAAFGTVSYAVADSAASGGGPGTSGMVAALGLAVLVCLAAILVVRSFTTRPRGRRPTEARRS